MNQGIPSKLRNKKKTLAQGRLERVSQYRVFKSLLCLMVVNKSFTLFSRGYAKR